MGALSASMLAIGSGTDLLADETPTDSTKAEVTKPDRSALKFHDGEFKILQLTDLHLSFYDEEETEQAINSLQFARELTLLEKPDLVILTGYIITGFPNTLTGWIQEAWDRVGEIFVELNIPYAVTLGNHDYDLRISPKEVMAMIEKNPRNITMSDDPSLSGTGNTVLSILASDGLTPRWNLWLLDSHSYPVIPGDNGEYDWIRNDQIQWYRKTSEALNANLDAPLPALAFFHIPLPEYHIVGRQPDKLGEKNEEVCSPELNSGLFTSFLEMRDVLGVFVGHDHFNDYLGVYKNILLAYGRKTGTTGYKNLAFGGRTIILKENERRFDTYIVTPTEKTRHFTFQRS